MFVIKITHVFFFFLNIKWRVVIAGDLEEYEKKDPSGSDEKSNQTEKLDIRRFEKFHIETVKEERLQVQKKTFTKWINSTLEQVKTLYFQLVKINNGSFIQNY